MENSFPGSTLFGSLDQSMFLNRNRTPSIGRGAPDT